MLIDTKTGIGVNKFLEQEACQTTIYEFHHYTSSISRETFWIVASANHIFAKLVAEDQRSALAYLRDHASTADSRTDLSGNRLLHLASKAAIRKSNGEWICIKNRFGDRSLEAVKDLEDLRSFSLVELFCAIRGWSSPMDIHVSRLFYKFPTSV